MVVTKKVSLQTKGDCDIIDITSQLEQQLAETDIRNGTVTLFVSGSTASIATIEYEPGLLADFQGMWDRLIPGNIRYEHDRAWAEANGHSHVRASLLGSSLVIPISNKRLTLGQWQQIVLVDFDDRPRSRQIVVQIMGE